MIEEKLGYKFKNPQLLSMALAHSSYANELSIESNERLEFLGDAVLGCVVSRFLYDNYPESSEGVLSKMKGAIVSRTYIARFARELGMDKIIMLGKGEEQTGGRERDSNLGGTFEALLGAVYLDGGFKRASDIVTKLLKRSLKELEIFEDHKTRLQEFVQKQFKVIPKYRVIREEGPPHDKSFVVEVKIGKKPVGKGSGKNKKEAEQEAAKEALHNLSSAQR